MEAAMLTICIEAVEGAIVAVVHDVEERAHAERAGAGVVEHQGMQGEGIGTGIQAVREIPTYIFANVLIILFIIQYSVKYQYGVLICIDII